MVWRLLIHLGDLPLTVAAAAAIAVWMTAARMRRLAFWWSLFFLSAIALVAATKVTSLVWGSAFPVIDFRALSGHATGVTAICVTLCYLAAGAQTGRWRIASIAIGMLLGVLMAALLVVHDEHSIAEAAAGWALGAGASIGAIRLAAQAPPTRAPHALMLAAVVFVATVAMVNRLPVGYVMWRAAKVIARHTGALSIAGF